MKYFDCKNPNTKALVALRAIKGDSISYLSSTYHVNPKSITIWKRQLIQKLHLEQWMIELFMKQPPFLQNEQKIDPDVF